MYHFGVIPYNQCSSLSAAGAWPKGFKMESGVHQENHSMPRNSSTLSNVDKSRRMTMGCTNLPGCPCGSIARQWTKNRCQIIYRRSLMTIRSGTKDMLTPGLESARRPLGAMKTVFRYLTDIVSSLPTRPSRCVYLPVNLVKRDLGQIETRATIRKSKLRASRTCETAQSIAF